MPSALTHHLPYLWLVTASFLAGILNAIAGGGSFLSFPAMLGVGVPPVQANATNTVALWPGQLTSVAALRSDLRRDLLAPTLAASVLGGLSGAWVLLHTRQQTFLHLVPWLLLVATVLFGVSGPVSRWLHRRSGEHRIPAPDPVLSTTAEATAAIAAPAHPRQHSSPTPPAIPVFLALLLTCFYIGYFGAGAGFLIMTTLALFGVQSMRELNSLKVLAACLSNLCAVITFILSGAVLWHFCLISLVFAAIGGWLGARYARRVNPNTLRSLVVITGLLVSAWFFYRQYAPHH